MESSDSPLQLLTSSVTPFSPACPVEVAVVADDAGHITPSGPSPVSSPADCCNGNEAVDRPSKSRGRPPRVKLLDDDATHLFKPLISGKRRRLTVSRHMSAAPAVPSARDLQLEVIRKQLTLVARRRKQAAEKVSAACATHSYKNNDGNNDGGSATMVDGFYGKPSTLQYHKSSASGLEGIAEYIIVAVFPLAFKDHVLFYVN
jgi:hypothetical protein